MLLDQILAVEMRNAGLVVGVGHGGIDQVADAGGLRRIGNGDTLMRLRFRPGLVAAAHQEHRVDAARGLYHGCADVKIAGNDLHPCRGQPLCAVAIRLA